MITKILKALLIAGMASILSAAPALADTIYTIDYVNVRKEPSLDAEIAGTLVPNTELERVAEGEEWDTIAIDEEEYYIFNEYITMDVPEFEIIEIDSIEPALIGYYKLTAYCSCSKCCGKNGGTVTRYGTTPTVGRTVACNSLEAGTKVMIYNHVYTVEDTGNMKDNVIDIYMASHTEALEFGVKKNVPVYLVY